MKLAIAALLAVPAVCNATGGKPFEIEDLFRFSTVSNVAMSPKGDSLVFVTTRNSRSNDSASDNAPPVMRSRLWLLKTDGGSPRALTDENSTITPTSVGWSPGGAQLAYISREGGVSRLQLVDDAGQGEALAVPVCPKGESVSHLKWAPSGERLAAICSRSVWEQTEDPPKAILASESVLFNGGRNAPEAKRIVVYDVGKGIQQSFGPSTNFVADSSAISWDTGDDRLFVVMSAGDYMLPGTVWEPRLRIAEFDVASGEETETVWEDEYLVLPTLSPDRRKISVATGGWSHLKVLTPQSGDVDRDNPFWSAISLRPRILDLESRDLTSFDESAVDLHISGRRAPVWALSPQADDSDQGVLYFLGLDHGTYRIKAFDPVRGNWRNITPESLNVTDFSVSGDGAVMAMVAGTANMPNEVYLLDLHEPEAPPRRMTHRGDDIRRLYNVPDIEKVVWRSKDNRFDIGGWLVKPPNYQRGKQYPLIIDVHGGPGVAFTNDFVKLHHEAASGVPPDLYAAAGFMVLMANPRGDPSYSNAFRKAILEGWEYPTRYDLIAGVEEMVRRGYADPNRLGISGASYGGWVTTYAITQTDMFKAAIANDPVIDTAISSAVAYRGRTRVSNYWLHAGLFGGLVGDVRPVIPDPAKVNTPILLRFGLRDVGFDGPAIYPSEFFVSGISYFVYLHTHCKPVEMLLHPYEGHGIFSWELRRDFMQRSLAWFEYWLNDKGSYPIKIHNDWCNQ